MQIKVRVPCVVQKRAKAVLYHSFRPLHCLYFGLVAWEASYAYGLVAGGLLCATLLSWIFKIEDIH